MSACNGSFMRRTILFQELVELELGVLLSYSYWYRSSFGEWNYLELHARAAFRIMLVSQNFTDERATDLWPIWDGWLQSAVSGLNRGLAASEDDLRKADAFAKELEGIGGPVDLSADLEKLQGRWKLIYSSAFSSRTLGGSRPGPPTGRLLPITLGQVRTQINPSTSLVSSLEHMHTCRYNHCLLSCISEKLWNGTLNVLSTFSISQRISGAILAILVIFFVRNKVWLQMQQFSSYV